MNTDEDAYWTILNRPNMSADDIIHLQSKGAFKVPCRGLMLELLTNYCNWIHPQLPVIDIHTFLNSVIGRNGPKISLLLFHAVMFAGAAHLDHEVLQPYGYHSRSVIQDELFNRVKVSLIFALSRSQMRQSVVSSISCTD